MIKTIDSFMSRINCVLVCLSLTAPVPPHLSHRVMRHQGSEARGVAVIHKLTHMEGADAGVNECHTILAEGPTTAVCWLFGMRQKE